MPGRLTLAPLLALVAALVAVAPALAGGGPGKVVGPGQSEGPSTDQIVLRLASGKSLDDAGIDATAGVELRHVRRLADGSYVLKLSKRDRVDAVREITDRLAARGDVVFAEPDAIMQPFAVPTDPRWSEQWDLFAPTASSFGIGMPAAWDITTGSGDITVGVIDTGYRPHTDLSYLSAGDRFVPGYDFIADAATANDGGGRDADASDPGDWCGGDPSSWHGTHVAGTIGAAANNGKGVAGINWVSKIQPLRVLGKCGGYTSDIADAIRWGAGLSVSGIGPNATPSRVLNLSLGGSGSCSSTYQSAIDAAVAAGTVVVVAAGNSNANAANYQPASCANVITVASTAQNGKRAYYSNYGSTVEIAAPGGDYTVDNTILSTLNAGATTPGIDSYDYYQGTSMATPHVVGVVSLMLSVNPGLTPAEVSAMLRANATPFPAGSTCTTSICGSGILNAAAAVAAAKTAVGPPGAFSKTAPAHLGTVIGTSATLRWGSSPGATSYQYCIDTTPDTTCQGSWVGVGAATSAAVTVVVGSNYSWQVRAVNAHGETLADGGSWHTFTVDPVPPAPDAFSKTSPTSGQTSVVRPVTLKWAASSGATSYEWCVSTTNNTCSAWQPAGAATSVSVTTLKSRKTYYWQVRAKNTGGTTSANDGTFWSFKTK